MCNGGDISGLRKGPASVVVRVHFPNNNTQLIFDPNNNTLAKFKLIYLFQEKNVFFTFLIRNTGKMSVAIL